MKKLSLADIHCDTAFEMFRQNQHFYDNSLSVSLKKAESYDEYTQVAAIWSDKGLDDEAAYSQFFKIVSNFKNDILSDSRCKISYCFEGNRNIIFSVEDARILNNDISRLKILYEHGVRILTLLWSGLTCIGGSFDTDSGLTDFGKSVVSECLKIGIVPDISHASFKSADDVFELCDYSFPIIASHSDSYAVNPHRRNLKDSHFEEIKKHRGLVGINLCPAHLGLKGNEDAVQAAFRHIEHYLALGGEDIICFGCDFDGTCPPAPLDDISRLYLIADEMSKRNYPDCLIEKIFYLNAKKFILKNIKYKL